MFTHYVVQWTLEFLNSRKISKGHIFQYGATKQSSSKAKRSLFMTYKNGVEYCSYGFVISPQSYVRMPSDEKASYDCENYAEYGFRE